MLLKITLKCFSLRVILDLLNQVVNVNAMWSFHHRIRHAWGVGVDVILIDCKVELVRVWWCSITMFGRTKFLHCVCVFVLDSTGFTVLSEEPSFSCKHLPTIFREQDVFPFSTKTRSVSTGFPVRSQIGLGLDWVGLEDFGTRCFSKRLLNGLSDWLLFNCRTRLIIPFSPLVIVFQWDLWWWSRRQISSFVQHFSTFQSLNFGIEKGVEVFLEE